MEATFLIIGGGIAGVSCADQLSFHCPEEKIIMISASSVVKSVTNLCHISKMLSTFDVREKNCQEFASEYSNLSVIQGIVNEVLAAKREVILTNGTRIKYHYLVLCHGARPKLLPNYSIDNNKFVLGIRDTESVDQFQTYLKDAKTVMVVGNGGIATEIVHELQDIDIIWAIKDDSISATFVDCGAGQFFLDQLNSNTSTTNENVENDKVEITKRTKYTALEFQKEESSKKTSSTILSAQNSSCGGAALGPDWHSNLSSKSGKMKNTKNITLETGTEVIGIEQKNEDEVCVTLSNGKKFICNFVVSATGVIPNGDSIKISDIKLDEEKGIIVNEQMETNLRNIYAAGDVCSCHHWKHSEYWFQMRLWTQARQMGAYAGQSMVHAWQDNGCSKKELDFCFEMFSHATNFFGYKVILLGLFNAQGLDVKDYEILLRVTKRKEYVKVVLKNGKMQGAILIGETDLEETFENLILNQMDLSVYGEDLLNPDIDIEDYFD